MQEKKMSLQVITTYITELMGVATLMILICHAVAYSHFPPMVVTLLNLCAYGVDIFLFLSGIGLYFSLSRRKETRLSLQKWYKHRYIRIGCTYLLITCVMQIILVLMQEQTIVGAFLNISTIGYWLNHSAAWFIALLIPLYFVAPILFRIQETKYGFIVMLIIMAALHMYGLLDIPHDNNSLAFNAQSAIRRSTGFIYGMMIGKVLYYDMRGGGKLLMYIIATFAGVWLITGKTPLWILLLPIVLLLGNIISYFKSPNRCLTFLGVISLESYLTNTSIGHLFKTHSCLFDATGCNYNNYLLYASVIIIGILAAYATHLVSIKIIKRTQL